MLQFHSLSIPTERAWRGEKTQQWWHSFGLVRPFSPDSSALAKPLLCSCSAAGEVCQSLQSKHSIHVSEESKISFITYPKFCSLAMWLRTQFIKARPEVCWWTDAVALQAASGGAAQGVQPASHQPQGGWHSVTLLHPWTRPWDVDR